MTRGKEAAAAAERRHQQALRRIEELERELAATRDAARRREVELEERLRTQGYEVMKRTSDRVQQLMTEHMERLTDGLSNAVWRAQRVAMTEHLTWLFFKGYLKWDRLDGDYEVLHFLATHGDLRAWFALTGKYGHHENHAARRATKRADPIRQMIDVLIHIDRAKAGKTNAQRERARLDEVVDYARDAFVNVELTELMTDEGWVTTTPTEEQLAMHREILDSLPEFRAVAERVESRA